MQGPFRTSIYPERRTQNSFMCSASCSPDSCKERCRPNQPHRQQHTDVLPEWTDRIMRSFTYSMPVVAGSSQGSTAAMSRRYTDSLVAAPMTPGFRYRRQTLKLTPLNLIVSEQPSTEAYRHTKGLAKRQHVQAATPSKTYHSDTNRSAYASLGRDPRGGVGSVGRFTNASRVPGVSSDWMIKCSELEETASCVRSRAVWRTLTRPRSSAEGLRETKPD